LLHDAVAVQGSDVHAHGVIGEAESVGEARDGLAGAAQQAQETDLGFSNQSIKPVGHAPE
jgi:hypothetical protein